MASTHPTFIFKTIVASEYPPRPAMSRQSRRLLGSMLPIYVLVVLLLGPLVAVADDPEVTVTRLENLPSRLFYFEDTPVSRLSRSVPLSLHPGHPHARPRHAHCLSLGR